MAKRSATKKPSKRVSPKRPKRKRFPTIKVINAEPNEAVYYSPSSYENRSEKGRPDFIRPVPADVRKVSVERAPVAAIKRWIGNRRNATWWRNRDGSYDAIATFKGRDAWERAQRAAQFVPKPAYVTFRYLIKEEYAIKREHDTGTRVRLSNRYILIPQTTPTARAENWVFIYGYVFAAFMPDEAEPEKFNGGVYKRLAGIAVFWPSGVVPVKKTTRKRRR